MDHYEWEKKTLKHNCYYVKALLIDVLQAKVHLELSFAPELNQTAVILDFHACDQLTIEAYYEREDLNSLAAFLGIGNIPQDAGVQYTITTNLVALSFITEHQPIVTWLDKSALSFDYQPEIIRISNAAS